MNKLVIANKGKAGCGKSSSIKEVFNKLIATYPYKIFIKDGDIKATITIENVLVGIESQGDPNSRMIQSMNDFVSMGCQIIVAACRTSGETCNKIIELNQINGYDIIWATNDKTAISQQHQDILNKKYAERVIALIIERINGIL